MAEKETIEVKVNESEEVAEVIEDLWDALAELSHVKRLLWTRLHRLDNALGLKE